MREDRSSQKNIFYKGEMIMLTKEQLKKLDEKEFEYFTLLLQYYKRKNEEAEPEIEAIKARIDKMLEESYL